MSFKFRKGGMSVYQDGQLKPLDVITNGTYSKSEIDSKITNKVDKIQGKGLSTNDYDNNAKTKVDAIPSNPKYTDTVVTDSHINDLIDAKLGVIENGTY